MRVALIVLFCATICVYGRHMFKTEVEQFKQNGLACSICKTLIDKITPFVDSTNLTGVSHLMYFVFKLSYVQVAHQICYDITLGNDALDSLCDTLVDDSIGKIQSDIQSGKTPEQVITF